MNLHDNEKHDICLFDGHPDVNYSQLRCEVNKIYCFSISKNVVRHTVLIRTCLVVVRALGESADVMT